MEDMDEPGMISGDRLIFQDSLKLSLETTLIFKIIVPDRLHCPKRTRYSPGKPYLTIGATAYFS